MQNYKSLTSITHSKLTTHYTPAEFIAKREKHCCHVANDSMLKIH